KTLVIEPNDARIILTTEYEGNLVHFVCGGPGGGGGEVISIDGGEGYIVTTRKRHRSNDPRYWIAVNGSSCALSNMPLRNPVVVPTPQQIWGFPTAEEARKAQHIVLTAPMKKVMKYLKSLGLDIKSGRVVYLRPDNPEPQTRGQAAWMEGSTQPP